MTATQDVTIGRRPRRSRASTETVGGLVSPADRRRRGVRTTLGGVNALVLMALVVMGAAPVYWTVKAALSGTQQLLHEPARLWPDPTMWSNLSTAWSQLGIGKYLVNTVVLVLGTWLVGLFVTITGAFAVSVLRPRFGSWVYAGVLATLFVPGTVTLISLYVTILDVPFTGWNLANTPWAIWLPASANAFNFLIMRQFFDGIPRDLFEAAELDGAGPIRLLRHLVLPMSGPIIATVSLITIMAAWKDFLWPLIVLTEPSVQPLSVALPRLAERADLSVLIAGMLIALVPPVIIFVIFQRFIVRGIGFTGLKG
ncbi:sugar ABC transporter permease [Luteimicrobium album]|uniref:Sugar ABC transporter permease n=1 Tax=Luteimicrobium album TaxID=1054550 RepID=A0ABQ6HYU6_9MICO|nr:carbohydrate ABC transporter permease [Luteimicrobium album]GMA23668.1 sugar ABC transporter permease [Luteimicrobium album]